MTVDVMSKAEHAAKLLDEVICLFRLYEQDYHVIDEALTMIAQAAQEHPNFPITAGLVPVLHARGLLPPDAS